MPHFGPPSELRYFFGHLPRAMFTLLKAISGGQNWGEICEPLKHVSWLLVIFFCIYIGVVVFAVLNIVTSIFIENARQMSMKDKDNLIWEEIQDRNWRGQALRGIFAKADSDGSEWLLWEEFKEYFEDPIVQAYFRTLGLDLEACGVKAFFDFLDVDRKGGINVETFVAGCTHFRGAATTMAIERLSNEFREDTTMVEAKIDRLQEDLSEMVGCIRAALAQQGTFSGLQARPQFSGRARASDISPASVLPSPTEYTRVNL